MVATEIPDVIPVDDDNLLSSVCSMMCARKDNTPLCIGFSRDISNNRRCILYTEVEVVTGTTTKDIWLR